MLHKDKPENIIIFKFLYERFRSDCYQAPEYNISKIRRPLFIQEVFEAGIESHNRSVEYIQNKSDVYQDAEFIQRTAELYFLLGYPDDIWKEWFAYTALAYYAEGIPLHHYYAILADETLLLKAFPLPDSRVLYNYIAYGSEELELDIGGSDGGIVFNANRRFYQALQKKDLNQIHRELCILGACEEEYYACLDNPYFDSYVFDFELSVMAKSAYQIGYRPNGLKKKYFQMMEPGFSQVKKNLIIDADWIAEYLKIK